MARAKSQWVCQECGFRTSAFLGRCTDCGTWSSLVEERAEPTGSSARRSGFGSAAEADPNLTLPVLLKDVKTSHSGRIKSGINGLDEVLGGGFVPGAVVLVAGDPGIGKSTLLLQVARAVGEFAKVLYVTGEESASQVHLRAKRLGIESESLFIASEQNIANVIESISRTDPQILILDSIQAVYSPDIASAAGSVSQVRESGQSIINVAKARDLATIIVGHVNKEGLVAGPRVLEHMVDVVLQFEGDRTRQLRILRSSKNRFGATSEIAIFSMNEQGLSEVENASAAFLGDRLTNPGRQAPSGTAVIAETNGNRTVLLEVQALVANTSNPSPRRVSNGWDYNRLLQILAVLEKRVGLYFGHADVYVNVVGGMDFEDPGGDLGICTAIATSLLDRSVDPRLLVIGEVGLTGEIRPVAQLEQKLKEAARLGFTRAIVPQANLPLSGVPERIQIEGVQLLPEALLLIMPGAKLKPTQKTVEPAKVSS